MLRCQISLLAFGTSSLHCESSSILALCVVLAWWRDPRYKYLLPLHCGAIAIFHTKAKFTIVSDLIIATLWMPPSTTLHIFGAQTTFQALGIGALRCTTGDPIYFQGIESSTQLWIEYTIIFLLTRSKPSSIQLLSLSTGTLMVSWMDSLSNVGSLPFWQAMLYVVSSVPQNFYLGSVVTC